MSAGRLLAGTPKRVANKVLGDSTIAVANLRSGNLSRVLLNVEDDEDDADIVMVGSKKNFSRLAYLAGKRLYLSNVTRGVISLDQLKVEK
jgi:hypothetical protein